MLRWVIACNIRLTSKFFPNENSDSPIWDDIWISSQVMSNFVTIHTCLRQSAIGSGNLRTNMQDKSYTVHVAGVDQVVLTHTAAMGVVQEVTDGFELKYDKPDKEDRNHWYGTAAPLIGFIQMFRFRMNELRVGHSTFTLSKSNGTTFNTGVDYYGLYSVHHPLLEGITIPPERKSSMAQSLGPMAALISLAKSDNDPKYAKRWKSQRLTR